jgi:hypothetical protein
MRHLTLGSVAVAWLSSSALSAQTTPLDQLLDQMGAYLIDYEARLSSVVADERFEQRVVKSDASGESLAPSRFRRVLESEVSFMRLPGGAEWLGFRDVLKVNGQPVRTRTLSLSDVLTKGADGMSQAKIIAAASAAHNLGLARTINVPTAPLEMVHPSHRGSFRFWRDGNEQIGSIETVILGYEETGRPTIVRQPDGTNVVGRGRVWVEAGTGVIWRIEWLYDRERVVRGQHPRIQVWFAMHEGLAIMVPVRMTELFFEGRTPGSGEASYSNFRRFTTGARLVPQP